jgi:hypothetical protein
VCAGPCGWRDVTAADERERERETGTTRTTAAMRNNVSNVYPPGLEPFRRAHGESNSSHYNRHPTTSTTPPRINQTEKVKFSDTHTVVVVDVVATFSEEEEERKKLT